MTPSKLPSLIGAGIALALFLAVALLPAMLYGGYAGVLLAGGIFGTPVEATLLPRILIVFGMVMGVVAVGSLFAVAGAVVGAAVGALTAIAGRKPAAQEQASRERGSAAPSRARPSRPGSPFFGPLRASAHVRRDAREKAQCLRFALR